jgi:hypothetical protein
MTASTSAPTLRRSILKLHRWLSLGAALFWLLQALTGVLIVFHWEITDAGITGSHRPTDLAAIEQRIGALVPPGERLRRSGPPQARRIAIMSIMRTRRARKHRCGSPETAPSCMRQSPVRRA